MDEIYHGEKPADSNVDAFDSVPESDKLEQMILFIRDKSYEGNVINVEELVDEPLCFEAEEVLLLLEELREKEEFADIHIMKRKNKIYAFSTNYITESYAAMIVSLYDKDLVNLVSDVVRKESKLYPRPTDIRIFNRIPFNLSKDEFNEVYSQIRKNDAFADIKGTTASNNALYLYSDKFLKKDHARSLAEWIEVEAEQNP